MYVFLSKNLAVFGNNFLPPPTARKKLVSIEKRARERKESHE
jgi:hypothetical protein